MVVRNPFKPTAGALPPLLVGRDGDIEEFCESIDDGPGSPSRITIYTGPRGVGKTVMLTEVDDRVAQMGWITISDTATPGLIARIARATTRHLEELGEPARRAVTGFTLPVVGGGLNMAPPPELQVDLREQMGHLLDILEANGTGLLLTVDEVHRTALEDMRALSTTYQHLTRDGRNVALALGGLPSSISDLLNDKVLTFLRRAVRVPLEDVDLADVSVALKTSINDSGREITDEALEAATQATGGYPFMIQLVGHQVWRKAAAGLIDLPGAKAGIEAARKRLGATVHEAALADLSAVDRTYLVAMAQDDGPSRTSEIATRMGESAQYASVYRQRLIDAGIIEPVGYGLVDFALPYLREYLREHAARYEMQGRLKP